MKLKKFFTKKVILTAAVLAATLGIGGATLAEFGPDRPTKAYSDGIAGFDHVTFNSFTGVPNIGDERNFMTGKIDQAPNGFYDPMNQVRDGNDILVRVYVHNNADSSLNASGAGIARNTKIRLEMPTNLAQAQQMKSYISADNAQPQTIFDTLDVNANYPFELAYEPGTATLTTNRVTEMPINDSALMTTGMPIGETGQDGNIPGCFEYVALVTFKVKVKAPNYSIQKTVRLDGEPREAWREEAQAQPGSTVEWKLEFQNTGATQLNGVDIFDQLPAKMSIVPGTTKIYNGLHPAGVDAGSDDVVKNGIDIGSYQQNTNAIVVFKAKVPDVDQLECGMNTFLNNGYAKPEGQGTVTDTATVTTQKQCNDVPTFSCDLLKAEEGDNRTVKYAVNASAAGGATIKSYIFNFGDNTQEFTTSGNTTSHTYVKDGQYTARVRVQFAVGNETMEANGDQCAAPVNFTSKPPVTPAGTTSTPGKLPETGAGSTAAIFVAVTAVSSIAYSVVTRRFGR